MQYYKREIFIANSTEYTLFYKQHFYKQRQTEIG